MSIKKKRESKEYDEKRAILQMIPYVSKEDKWLIEALREKLKKYIYETGKAQQDDGQGD